MERLEKKRINGHEYYYYSKWGWKNGRCKRLWQRYLGTLDGIVNAVGGGETPAYAEVFEHGLTMSLWNESRRLGISRRIGELCPKQGRSFGVGDYICLAAINRAVKPASKNGIWGWFAKTSLVREMPELTRKHLSSQRFWDNMDAVDVQAAKKIWENIIAHTAANEKIDMSRVSYDGTNFYTFISTFNVRNTLGKRGKNKQGRSNLRQVSYALFCTKEGIPLYYDVYEGNSGDAKVFPRMLDGFCGFMKKHFGADGMGAPSVTLVFDKGNNSRENFERLDASGMKFVGSLKLAENKELAGVSNKDKRFRPIEGEGMEGMKAFFEDKLIHGRKRRLVVMFNNRLFNDQWKTLHEDGRKAMEELAELGRKLDDRNNGLTRGGTAPTRESLEASVKKILRRPFLKDIIRTDIRPGKKAPVLDFELLPAKLEKVADTYLGKKIIVADTGQNDISDIVETYHGQYVIEHVFKEMKSRDFGTWWPLFHWTDQKIHVHGLYCTIAVLLRATMHRRTKISGLKIPMKRMLDELSEIKEVVNVFSGNGKKRKEKCQTTFTRLNLVQKKLFSLFLEKRGTDANLG